MASHLCLITIIFNIMTIVIRTDRPSKQNRETIKEKVINWYQNNPLKISINSLQKRQKENDKITLNRPSLNHIYYLPDKFNYPFEINLWDKDFVAIFAHHQNPLNYPIDHHNNEQLIKLKGLKYFAGSQVPRMPSSSSSPSSLSSSEFDKHFPFYSNYIPKGGGGGGEEEMDDEDGDYYNFYHNRKVHSSNLKVLKQTIHYVPVPVSFPIKSAISDKSSFHIAPWIWPLAALAVPIIIFSLFLPLAFMFIFGILRVIAFSFQPPPFPTFLPASSVLGRKRRSSPANGLDNSVEKVFNWLIIAQNTFGHKNYKNA